MQFCYYNTARLDAKIVNPDGGIHSSHFCAEFANPVSPTPSVLPLEGWTSCLQQLPPFNFGCLYAHICTDSKTIVKIQQITAVYGYYLFRDDHVQVVWF